MRLLVVVCVALCAPAVVARGMKSAPLQEKFLPIFPPDEDDAGFAADIPPPPPHVKADVVAWDPSSMPRPDPSAVMTDTPDRAFVPSFSVEDELAPGPVHTTRRNMVLPGSDMISLAKDSDLRAALPDTLVKLEALSATDMPLTPSAEVGPDCTDEDSVLRVGERPVFSRSPLMPTKDAKGTGPEVNSFKDFVSGMVYRPFVPTLPNQVPTEVISASANLNPASGPLEEQAIAMGYKFTGTIEFRCGFEMARDFEKRYGRTFREGLALSTKIPVGNVGITNVAVGNVISFEIGAPSIAHVGSEVSALKESIQLGDFSLSLRARGFPVCDVGHVTIGAAVEDGNLNMPEPTLKQQMGPPGGPDDDALTPEEQRERVRVREAMTYGEYTKPGRYNLANLSPHLFKDGQKTVNDMYYVVGRIKFLVKAEGNTFQTVYAPLVTRALASIAAVETDNVTISVNGVPSSNVQMHFGTLLQLSGGNRDEDGYTLLDFEIPSRSLEGARTVQTSIVSGMSDMKTGFRAFLANTRIFPVDMDFTLLFIEIHGVDGMPLDVCDEEDDDDADDEKSLEGRIGKLSRSGLSVPTVISNVTVVNGHIVSESMNNPVDCNTTTVATPIARDTSMEVKQAPRNSNDTWPVMGDHPATPRKAYMNLPGRDVISTQSPTFNIQLAPVAVSVQTPPVAVSVAAAPAKPAVVAVPSVVVATADVAKPALLLAEPLRHPMLKQSRHFIDQDSPSPAAHVRDAAMGLAQLNQLEWRESSKPLSAMKESIASQVLDVSSGMGAADKSSSEMPEADASVTAPAGGFPLPDNDEGAL